jgi:hypothetical protein
MPFSARDSFSKRCIKYQNTKLRIPNNHSPISPLLLSDPNCPSQPLTCPCPAVALGALALPRVTAREGKLVAPAALAEQVRRPIPPSPFRTQPATSTSSHNPTISLLSPSSLSRPNHRKQSETQFSPPQACQLSVIQDVQHTRYWLRRLYRCRHCQGQCETALHWSWQCVIS